jgi:hypothetical protein
MTVYFESLFEELSDALSDAVRDEPGEAPVPEITPDGIRRRHCACCGQPARVSFHDLKRHRRTLLCDACRPPAQGIPPLRSR